MAEKNGCNQMVATKWFNKMVASKWFNKMVASKWLTIFRDFPSV
jgi:hypothetical protein